VGCRCDSPLWSEALQVHRLQLCCTYLCVIIWLQSDRFHSVWHHNLKWQLLKATWELPFRRWQCCGMKHGYYKYVRSVYTGQVVTVVRGWQCNFIDHSIAHVADDCVVLRAPGVGTNLCVSHVIAEFWHASQWNLYDYYMKVKRLCIYPVSIDYMAPYLTSTLLLSAASISINVLRYCSASDIYA